MRLRRIVVIVMGVIMCTGMAIAGGMPQDDVPCKKAKAVECPKCPTCKECGPVECKPEVRVVVKEKPVVQVRELIRVVEPPAKGRFFLSASYFNFEGHLKDGVGAGAAYQFAKSKVIVNAQLMTMRLGQTVAPSTVSFESCKGGGDDVESGGHRHCRNVSYGVPGHVEKDALGVGVNVLIPLGK